MFSASSTSQHNFPQFNKSTAPDRAPQATDGLQPTEGHRPIQPTIADKPIGQNQTHNPSFLMPPIAPIPQNPPTPQWK
jgi:hypothetical protein